MKNGFFVLIITLALGCHNSELSKMNWAQSEVECSGELRMVLLLEGDLAKLDHSSVLAKITDEDKILRIDNALNDARYICRSYDTVQPRANQKAICFVDVNDNGYMIRIDLNEEAEKVIFAGGYSENLYKALGECGVSESSNNPDVIPFSYDPELVKIRFVSMPEYAGCKGNLKKIVFLEGDHYDFTFSRTENLNQLAEITDQNEIEKIKHAFSTARYCIFHIPEFALIETAIGFIYEDGYGELLRIAPNKKDQIVEFQGGYSKELYEIIVSHGIDKKVN